MQEDRKIYNVKEVARILQIDPESVRRYTRTGELKQFLLGGKFIRIDKEDLDNFIAQRKPSFYRRKLVTNSLNKPVNSGKIWHSPLNSYWHVQKLTDKIGQKSLRSHPKYQLIRESLIASVIALIMFKMKNIPAYIQLYKQDPPDALVMQPSAFSKGQLDISLLEITQFNGLNEESLLDQLKRKKINPKINTLSDFYILVVDLWPGLEVDFEEIREYLNKNKIPFPVWVIQEIGDPQDTLASLTIVNPEIQRLTVNIGEAAHIYKQVGAPDVLRTRRVGNKKLVRTEKAVGNEKAPWETIGE